MGYTCVWVLVDGGRVTVSVGGFSVTRKTSWGGVGLREGWTVVISWNVVTAAPVFVLLPPFHRISLSRCISRSLCHLSSHLVISTVTVTEYWITVMRMCSSSSSVSCEITSSKKTSDLLKLTSPTESEPSRMNVTSLAGELEGDNVVMEDSPEGAVVVGMLGRCCVGLGSRRGATVVVVVPLRTSAGVVFGVGGFGTSGSIPKVQR